MSKFLLESFYPTEEKYICIDNSANCPAKAYPLWEDVIRIISPKLVGIKIYCLGDQLPNCEKIPQNIHQIHYVIRNSLLLAGNFSYSCYIGAESGVPTVTVYGAYDPKIVGPKNSIAIEPESKTRHSFNPQDLIIKNVKPEIVANTILKELGLEESSHKTIFVGERYPQHLIEIIPNVIVNPVALNGQVPIIRCDYYYDEHFLIENLKRSRCSVFSDKEINLEIYKNLKGNIASINQKVSMETSESYIKRLINIGVDVKLWAEENMDEIRFKFIDIDLVHQFEWQNSDIDVVGKNYRSFKFILSDNKVYISKQAWLENRPIESPDQNNLKIIEDSLDFRKEMCYFRLYE